MLPLMLFGRLLFGSASQSLAGTMTSQDLETLRRKININNSPYQLCRTASQPPGLRTKSWAWLLAWLLVSLVWDRSWTFSPPAYFKKNMDCNGHSGVVGQPGSWMAQSCMTKSVICAPPPPVFCRCPAVCVWIYNRNDSQHLGQCQNEATGSQWCHPRDVWKNGIRTWIVLSKRLNNLYPSIINCLHYRRNRETGCHAVLQSNSNLGIMVIFGFPCVYRKFRTWLCCQ